MILQKAIFSYSYLFIGSVVRGHTRADYTYNSLWMSMGTATSTVLEIKAAGDAHILLSTMLSFNDNTGKSG